MSALPKLRFKQDLSRAHWRGYGAVLGRVRIKSATQPNITACSPKTHGGTPKSADKTSTAPMESTAAPLALLLIAPWSCQSLISPPKTLCSNSQRCSRGEERAKAKAAISKNTVVGSKGSTAPMAASPTHSSPKQSHAPRRREYFGPSSIGVIIV